MGERACMLPILQHAVCTAGCRVTWWLPWLHSSSLMVAVLGCICFPPAGGYLADWTLGPLDSPCGCAGWFGDGDSRGSSGCCSVSGQRTPSAFVVDLADYRLLQMPRCYHIGTKGTFMNMRMHRMYFADIATVIDGDTDFWSSSRGTVASHAVVVWLTFSPTQRICPLCCGRETRH